MQAFELSDVISESERSGRQYREFLRQPDLSMGVYRLPTGGSDPQSPHTEDEVYYEVRGKAVLRVAGEDRPVQTGSLLYVPKHAEHKFHSIEQDLTLLVFFAPAEYSESASHD